MRKLSTSAANITCAVLRQRRYPFKTRCFWYSKPLQKLAIKKEEHFSIYIDIVCHCNKHKPGQLMQNIGEGTCAQGTWATELPPLINGVQRLHYIRCRASAKSKHNDSERITNTRTNESNAAATKSGQSTPVTCARASKFASQASYNLHWKFSSRVTVNIARSRVCLVQKDRR